MREAAFAVNKNLNVNAKIQIKRIHKSFFTEFQPFYKDSNLRRAAGILPAARRFSFV
jgi:hypothetical protein